MSNIEFNKKPAAVYLIEYSPNGYVHVCLTEKNFLKWWNDLKKNGNTHLKGYIYEPRDITALTDQKVRNLNDNA